MKVITGINLYRISGTKGKLRIAWTDKKWERFTASFCENPLKRLPLNTKLSTSHLLAL